MQSNLSKRINELLVLAVIDDDGSHGYQIALRVEERTDGRFTFQHGTLYPILHRLEKEGLVRGDWEGGGRRRKIYRLKTAGRARLKDDASSLREEFGVLLELLDGVGNVAA